MCSMTQKSLNLVKEWGKYWKVFNVWYNFDDEQLYSTPKKKKRREKQIQMKKMDQKKSIGCDSKLVAKFVKIHKHVL